MQERQNRRVARGRRRTAPRRRWLWLALLAIGLVAAGALALGAWGQETPKAGTLTPERTVHDFGEAPIGGGLLAAAIPLAVDGPVEVVNIATT